VGSLVHDLFSEHNAVGFVRDTLLLFSRVLHYPSKLAVSVCYLLGWQVTLPGPALELSHVPLESCPLTPVMNSLFGQLIEGSALKGDVCLWILRTFQ